MVAHHAWLTGGCWSLQGSRPAAPGLGEDSSGCIVQKKELSSFTALAAKPNSNPLGRSPGLQKPSLPSRGATSTGSMVSVQSSAGCRVLMCCLYLQEEFGTPWQGRLRFQAGGVLEACSGLRSCRAPAGERQPEGNFRGLW